MHKAPQARRRAFCAVDAAGRPLARNTPAGNPKDSVEVLSPLEYRPAAMNPILEMHSPEPGAVDRLARALSCHPAVAAVLVNRGIGTETDARRFLDPKLADLRAPFGLAGMDRAVERIVEALERNEKIMIFGDYDADGVTATVLLHTFLREAGGRSSVYIPHRVQEGYGLKPAHVTEVAVPAGIGLIVTVDCGVSSHEAVREAAARNIDVVITDHHRLGEELPEAAALVNPQRSDCEAGFESLAGVGVAFQLAVCLRSRLRDAGVWNKRPEPDLRRYCDLVAIGTVADIVPMTGDNRILTCAGIDLINQGARPGLTALIATCGLMPGRVTATDIAYRLAPRLNAAGRIAHASLAFDLLCETDPVRARSICRQLNDLNGRRQDLETEILDGIQERIHRRPELLDAPALVFAQEDWHPGVLGIVASRLARTHSRPAVLLALANDLWSGSGRAASGVNLHACLEDCRSLLAGFGGHAQAAGLRFPPDRLDDFVRAFQEAVTRHSRPEDLVPRIDVDFELDLSDITVDFVNAVEGLGPFGTEHTEPVFLARDLDVTASRIVGGRHLKMALGRSDRRTIDAIRFNADAALLAAPPQRIEKIAFRVGMNRWNGHQNAQMLVEAIWA